MTRILPHDELASHPGCIPVSRPAFSQSTDVHVVTKDEIMTAVNCKEQCNDRSVCC